MTAPVEPDLEPRVGAPVFFPAVEGMRAVAAGLVFIHHIGFFTGATFNSRLGGLLDTFDVGVPVFFALSGFLLFRPMVESLLDDRPLADTRLFWWKRFWRVYPAYWVVLTLVYFVVRPEVSTEAPVREYWIHYLLLQIYPSDGVFEGISQAWTLAVEVSFYAVLPLLAFGARRLIQRRPVSQRAILLLGGCGALFGLSLAWRFTAMALDWPFNTTLWLFGTIDYFAIGMALAVIHAWSARRPIAVRLRRVLESSGPWWWAVAFAVLAFVGYQISSPLGPEDQAPWHIEIFRQMGYEVVAFLLVVPAIFSSPTNALHRLLVWRPIAFLGAVSYSFYLWHTAVIEEYMQRSDRPLFLGWGPGETSLTSPVLYEIVIVSFAVTTLLAWVTFRLVERPVSQWSRRHRPRR